MSRVPQVHWLDGATVDAGTVFCFARNSFAHALELGNAPPKEPLLFLKSARSLRPLDGGGVAFPGEVFHHEAEVVLLIGREVGLGEAAGWDAVAGVALGLDLTRRGVQGELKRQGLPWTVAKSFGGAAPLGPFVPLARFPNPDRIAFSLSVEGAPRQAGRLDQMTFSVPVLLTWLARLTPFGPGDLVFTGTPEGVAGLRAGERFVLRLDDLDLEFAGRL